MRVLVSIYIICQVALAALCNYDRIVRAFRRILAPVVIVAVMAGSGWGAGAKLDIVDYRGEYLYAADATYFYGMSGSVLKRYAHDDYSLSNGVDFGGTLNPNDVWIGQAPGELYIQVNDSSTNVNYLYRSTDYGATATQVCKIGWDADGWPANSNTPTHIPNCTIMHPGFTYDKWNHQYFFVEYNNAPSRVAGLDYDQVRLMKSSDGVTWTEVAHWNTDGSTENILYGHHVGVDPYTQAIYICFGDGAPSGFIKWDGISALASNQNIATYANALGGSAKYNAVHMFFTPTYIIWGADISGDASIVGIWRTTKDLAAPTRVYNSIPTTGSRDMLYGLQTSTAMYLTEHQKDTSDRTSFIYSSLDGSNWEKTARFQYQNVAGNLTIKNFFAQGDYVYLSLGQYPAGKGTYDTLVLQEQGAFTDEGPICIHPVYWVETAANGGSNSNDGFSPSTPWLTLKYALTSNHVTYGSRIIIGSGTFTEAATVAAYSANSYGTTDTATDPIVIEGQGRDKTFIINPAGTNGPLLYFGDGFGRAIIKNLSIKDLYASSGYTIGLIASTNASAFKIMDCTVGDTDSMSTALIRGYANRAMTIKRTMFVAGSSLYPIHLSNTATVSATISNSIFVGGSRHINEENGTLIAYNNTFYNYSAYGVRLAASATTACPILKNNIFYGAASGTRYGYEDNAGWTETDAQIDYNDFYSNTAPTVSCANSGGSHSKTANPLFVSTTDFHLKNGSPCINTGLNSVWSGTANVTDYAGTKITDAAGNIIAPGGVVDIGAYEYKSGSNLFWYIINHKRKQ